jgi:hypothetical protein
VWASFPFDGEMVDQIIIAPKEKCQWQVNTIYTGVATIYAEAIAPWEDMC